MAFLCAVLVSMPRVLTTPVPREVTQRVAGQMLRFVSIATILLMLPIVIDLGTWWYRGASWIRGSLFLYAIPGAMVLGFPFAMSGAVDAIRRHGSLPGHVERAAAIRLGAFAVAFMLFYGGWVVPAANQASRSAMNPPGMSAPLRGFRDLSTLELALDPARATVFDPGTNSAARATGISQELNKRTSLVILPLVLLWLRWRALGRPRRGWFAPLPAAMASLITIAAMVALSYLGVSIELQWQLWAGSAAWAPIVAFLIWGFASAYGRRFLPGAPAEAR
jgi:amino acid transporter